ncbi:hypothetical protein [Rhizobium bangladeshense]|uniref:hypothetical protein n=1 Tax=Rhizobium bangladeshense TaxID=1138189 RepID=UPI002180BC66|nr:hypothetical protein [Rhizobium bangladeshense]
MVRESGFEVNLVDPLTDNLADRQRPGMRYDLSHSHGARRFRHGASTACRVTCTGGGCHASVREGDGEDVCSHGGAEAPRRYVETYWREPALRSVLTDAGWIVSEIRRCIGKPNDRWLSVRASRA